MPSATPARAIPYALDNDPRALWPTTSRQVAERVDALMAADAAGTDAALGALAGRATTLEGLTDLTDVFVGVTWGAGWELSDLYARALGHLVFIGGKAKRTGGNISPGTAGDIVPNLTVATFDLGGRIPLVPTGLVSTGGRRGCFFRAASSSGNVSVQLVAVTGTANIDTNDVAEFTGMFLAAVAG